MNQEQELVFVTQWQNGDQESFTEVVRRYLPLTVNLAYRYLKDRHLAEDIAQEIFLKLYENPQIWKPTAKFSTWLYRVTLNACTDEWRKRKKIGSWETGELSDFSPASELIAAEQKEMVNRMIDSLAPFQRRLMLLYQEGLSYKEIAEILHCSVKAIERRLWRTKRKLRKLLEVTP